MPFACSVSGGTVQISPANDTAYRIAGPRDEQPFVVCPNVSGAACETMMVHRFAIECEGQRVAWSRVALAARAAGVALPTGLPQGFAPVSTMAGRFVLPSLTKNTPFVSRVAMQDLSPDSVTDEPEQPARAGLTAWDTSVSSDVPMEATGGATRVGGSLVAVMALLFAASMVAAGRWRMPVISTVPHEFAFLLARFSEAITTTLSTGMAEASRLWKSHAAGAHSVEHANALSMAEARLIQTEFSISVLSPDLLLRDVLSAEIVALRQRLDDAKRQLARRSPDKTSAIIRALMRDLDRINRISQSAAQSAQQAQDADQGMPQTVAEAYRVLGINADAAPAVAKKLVDALRMSWHPDHARDEDDRRRREGRMKQINAAWDLVKDRRAAA